MPFLYNENVTLRCLTNLPNIYQPLSIVTNYFMNNQVHLIRNKIANLHISEPFIRLENFHQYFSRLLTKIIELLLSITYRMPKKRKEMLKTVNLTDM